MRLSKSLIGVSALAGMSALTGCNDSVTSVLQLNGHYDGSVTVQTRDAQTNDVIYKQTAVGTDVSVGGPNSSAIVLKDGSGKSALTLTLSDLSDDSVTLQSSVGMSQPLKLPMDPVSQCYVAHDSVDVTLCAANLIISLQIQNPKDHTNLILSTLYRKADGTPQVKESPRAYTLSDALDQVRAHSFASRIEYQQVVQAKLGAKSVYEHLLPQISISTVANMITPSWTAALGAIGDLAPFLLPNRWFQADAASQQAKAEQDTYLVMRLDMAAQVEGLFYSYARDKATRDLTQKIMNDWLTDPVRGLQHQIGVLEGDGELPKDSTKNIDLIVNQFQQSLASLNQVVTEDLEMISQTLGYMDPSTVTDASVPPMPSLDGVPDSLDLDTIKGKALARSFEVEQIKDLMAAAGDNKSAAPWTFLDPYGDPSLFLSFALPTKLDIIQAQIDQLQATMDSVGSIVGQKAGIAVANYAAAVSGYKLSQAAMTDQDQILNDKVAAILDGTNVDFVGLSVLLQQYIGGQIAVETAAANFRIAQSEVDRLLLQGNYAKF